MELQENIAREFMKLEVEADVAHLKLADSKEFLGVVHEIWRARTADGREFWVIPYPVCEAYPVERWPDPEQVFTYHIGSAFRHWDAEDLIVVVGPPLIGPYPAKSPCGDR